jgi:hypothetical protein
MEISRSVRLVAAGTVAAVAALSTANAAIRLGPEKCGLTNNTLALRERSI